MQIEIHGCSIDYIDAFKLGIKYAIFTLNFVKKKKTEGKLNLVNALDFSISIFLLF